jgi:hypothetical protein
VTDLVFPFSKEDTPMTTGELKKLWRSSRDAKDEKQMVEMVGGCTRKELSQMMAWSRRAEELERIIASCLTDVEGCFEENPGCETVNDLYEAYLKARKFDAVDHLLNTVKTASKAQAELAELEGGAV